MLLRGRFKPICRAVSLPGRTIWKGGLGWRNGSFVGVLLVAFGAALGHGRGLAGPAPGSHVAGGDRALRAPRAPFVFRAGRRSRVGSPGGPASLAVGRPADHRLGRVRARDSPFTTAFVLGNPTVVILLQKTQPLFAIALAHVLLRERLRWAYWPCFAVAVLGAYLISFDGLVEPFEALGVSRPSRRSSL